MGVSDRVSGGIKGLATNVQDGMRSSFISTMLFTFRLVTGLLLGSLLGLIVQELMGFGNLGLTFLILVVVGLFMKMSSTWSFGKILVFDIICVLVAQVLRMYIQLAP